MKKLDKLLRNLFGSVYKPKGVIEGGMKSNTKSNNKITIKTTPTREDNKIILSYEKEFNDSNAKHIADLYKESIESDSKEKDFNYGITYESVINRIDESFKEGYELHHSYGGTIYFKINSIFASKKATGKIDPHTEYRTSINALSIAQENDSRIFNYLHKKHLDSLKKLGEEKADVVKEFLKTGEYPNKKRN